MAGMPKRRAKRAAEARQALSEKAKAMETTEVNPNTKYAEELANEIVMLIAEGYPIDNTLIGDQLVRKGVATKVGVSARSIYRWQAEYPDFAEKIKQAREESAHRHADQVQALSNVALDNPAMAQAVRVASDNLKWLAMVRNRQYYSESRRIDLDVNISDLGHRLRRAKERVIEGEKPLTVDRAPVDAEIIETVAAK